MLGIARDVAATLLTPQDLRDLIPAHISYRHELNEAEQNNIRVGILGRWGASAICSLKSS
jgi:hypothetical protein